MVTTNISGFPEFLPKDQIAFHQTLKKIQKIFELHGFSPLDTPAVERTSTLLSKGNDHEIYGLYRLAEGDGLKEKDLALRFDLTVPLARYTAQHYGKLIFPYRRYHIAPVWRGERPQAGRYRQFYQCDIDIIGDGGLSVFYDAEALCIVNQVLKSLGLERFVMKINHRALLSGLLQSFGALGDQVSAIMRTIDKADKLSKEGFKKELDHHSLHEKSINTILTLVSMRLSNQEWIQYLSTLTDHSDFQKGLLDLKQTYALALDFGISDDHLEISPTLARGLTYYTGIVAETKLLDDPGFGSIAGGGRYANLSEQFSNRQLPGVGFSIGLSRLFPKLIEMGIIKSDKETPAIVLVTTQNPQLLKSYIEIAKNLRNEGIATELFLDDKPLQAQMKYANKKNFPYVIIANEHEVEQNKVILKVLESGEQLILSLDEVTHFILSKEGSDS